MKNGWTITTLATQLSTEFGDDQDKFPRCTRRNRVPAEGWSICGHSGITRAIAKAYLPLANFWSGSLPTPSSQAPSQIVKRARELAYE